MNDKLREALVIANALQNAITEELAASKQEPQANPAYPPDDGPLTDEQIAAIKKAVGKQKPQAQAEPEPLCWIKGGEIIRWNGLSGMGFTGSVIPLQSHREAMAKMQVEITNRGDWLVEWNKCKEEIQRLEAHCIAYREAIAKKDAALDACEKDAARYRWICQQDHKDRQWMGGFEEFKAARDKAIDAAITQSKEARQ